MAEPLVCHVVFHLPEDGFRFDAPPSPVLDSLFRREPPPGFLPVSVQAVVDFDNPVPLGLEAASPERAARAAPGLVAGAFGGIPALRSGAHGADTLHVLPHRADVVVAFGIVIQGLRAERVGLVALALLDVEPVVFDIGGDAGLLHETVVLLRAVAGIGDDRARQPVVTAGKRAEGGYQGERVAGVLEQAEVKDELVFRPYLQVVARLGLPVVHRVLLHAHERGVGVGFGVGVAAAEDAQFPVIFAKFAGVFLEPPYLFSLFFPVPLTLFRRGFRFFLQGPVELVGNGHEL